MIQRSGSYKTTWVLKFLLLISVSLISACENDEIVKPQTQSEPSEPPLPVREWYPAPKQRQQATVYVPVPATQQQPVMAPPAYQGYVVQQPWGTPASQPMYAAPQVVYQPQPPGTQYQQPQVWITQPPVATMPQPVTPRYQPQYQPQYQYQYQYVPRPWGSLTEPNNNQNPAVSTETWPQGGYISPWGAPVTGSNNNEVYYGNVW